MTSSVGVPHSLPAGFTPSCIDLPKTFSGIVQSAPDGKPTISHHLTLSLPGLDQVVIKNAAVAINPYDWKMPLNFPSPGARIGCDLYGKVLAIGPEARTRRPDIQLGDLVCGAVFGSNPIDHGSGSFCDYVSVPADLLIRLPTGYAGGAAAALGGTSFSTLRLALWDSLPLTGTPTRPLDRAKPVPHVLVYGGSTATGTMALQLLRLSGYKPITTCSPRNFELVKGYGAEAAFDYHSPTCAADIKAYTRQSLSYVLDIITDAKSQAVCYAALCRGGGVYTALEAPGEAFNTRKRTVKVDFVVGLCALGGEVALPGEYYRPADPTSREHAGEFFDEMQTMVEEGKIRPHPHRMLSPTWHGVLKGIEESEKGKISGERLVALVE